MASADEDSDSSLLLSSQETQFVPREGDEEVLWTVIAITGETKKAYKVRWDGVDPATNKPWPQSWVLKHDCTDDIVAAWKLSKAKKKREAERKSAAKKGKERQNAVSRTSKRAKSSAASSSTSREQSTRTTTGVTSERNHTPTTKASPSHVPHSSSLRKVSVEIKRKRVVDSSDDELPTPSLAYLKDVAIVLPQRKKRKTVSEDEESVTERMGGEQLYHHDENDRFPDNSSKPKPKNLATTKRKQGESDKTRQTVQDKSHKRPVAMKTARKSFDPVGNVQASSATRRKKQVQARPESSSEDELMVAKSLDTEVKSKVSANRRHAPKGRAAQVVHLTERQGNSSSNLDNTHELSSAVLSPRTKARLAEFDALNLEVVDPPVERGSLPPIEVLDDAAESFHTNGRRSPSSSRSRANSHPPAHLYKASRSKPKSGEDPLISGPSNALDLSIVPETEPESSCNTQSEWQLLPSSHTRVNSALPLRTADTPARIQPQSPASPRNTIISRMKTKTPSSSPSRPQVLESPSFPTLLHMESQHMKASLKPLRQVPVVSPSVFQHLSDANPPQSSAPESRIESEQDVEVEAYFPSPIEHFSSPEKSTKDKQRNGGHANSSSSSRASSRLHGDEAMRKKQRLHANTNTVDIGPNDTLDRVRAKRTYETKGGVKRSLDELLRAQRDLKLASDVRHTKVTVTNESKNGPEPEAAQTVDEGTGPSQEIPNSYVDMPAEMSFENSMTIQDSGIQADEDSMPAYIRLRKEEEESTQEAMMHHNGITSLGADVEMTPIDEFGSQLLAKEALTVTKDRIATPQPLVGGSGQGEGNPANSPITGTLETNDGSSPPPVLHSEGVNVDTTYSVDMQTVEIPGQQPAQIESSVVPEDPSSSSLLPTGAGNEPEATKEVTVSTDSPIPSPISVVTELQQQLAALQTSLDEETRARKAAESDRDFFREQYTLASSFVSSVQAENTELSQRAEIAEKRAIEGVGLVRATFTERIRMLEAEVAKARCEVRLLVERDRRTGDDIRRRAGEEPELRARCERLQKRVEELEYEKEGLEMDLDDLEAEKGNWLNEVEVRKQLDVGEVSTDADAEDDEELKQETEDRLEVDMEGDSGNKMVHRCQWRIDGPKTCDWSFSDIEDLQQHLFLSGHLQEAWDAE